jgi:hypothetical protein
MPLSVELLCLPTRCYRCGVTAWPVVGVLVPGAQRGRFIAFDRVADALARVPSPLLAELGVGAIKRRRSRARPAGYLANGCVNCDAILGGFPLQEDLDAFLAEGGRLSALSIGRIELAA